MGEVGVGMGSGGGRGARRGVADGRACSIAARDPSGSLGGEPLEGKPSWSDSRG